MRRTKIVNTVTVDKPNMARIDTQEEVRLIKNTRFEKWLIKMKKPNSDQRKIFIAVMIAYYYMRKILGMQYQAISIEDFETIEERFTALDFDVWSEKYKGYNLPFDLPKRVFGDYCNWFGYKPWSYPDLFSFDPFSLRTENLIISGRYEFTLPPNIQDLTREIYQKRFGRPIPRPDTMTAPKIEPSLTPQSGDTAAEQTPQNEQVITEQTPE